MIKRNCVPEIAKSPIAPDEQTAVGLTRQTRDQVLLAAWVPWRLARAATAAAAAAAASRNNQHTLQTATVSCDLTLRQKACGRTSSACGQFTYRAVTCRYDFGRPRECWGTTCDRIHRTYV
jgi:hypothetical protein